ncbi:MAG TPA: hypothetical protein VJR06_08045 [Nitrososphaerales archaeon]|nr:hypothetical protein [Nitrososphaerales archaeon]
MPTYSSNVTVLKANSGALVGYLNASGVRAVYDPTSHSVFVASQGSNLYVINDTTNKVEKRLQLPGSYPSAMLFDSMDNRVFVAYGGSGYLSLLDASTNTFLANNSSITVKGSPSSLTLNTDTGEVYVGNGGSGIAIVNGSTLNVSLTTLRDPTFGPVSVAYDPATHMLFGINDNGTNEVINGLNDQVVGWVSVEGLSFLRATYDPDNNKVYAASPSFDCSLPGNVSIFDPSPHPPPLQLIPAGDGPSDVTYDSTDHRLFVTNYCSNNLTAIDTLTNLPIRATMNTGTNPFGIDYDPNNGFLYVANWGTHNISVFNASSLALVKSISLSQTYPFGVSVDPVSNQVYVTDLLRNNVTILNASTNTVAVPALAVGLQPQGMLYDPQNGYMYIANSGSNNITVLNGSTHALVTTIPVVGGPVDLALDPSDHLIFSADAGGSRISVVDTVTNTRLGLSLPASQVPQGIAYVPTTHQLDVFNWVAAAINILANVPQVTVAVSPSPTEVGVGTTVTTTAANGTPPYSYAYADLPSGCTGVDAPTIFCIPQTNATFSSMVTVTDAVGYTWTTPFNLTVGSSLAVQGYTATPRVIDLGMLTTLSVSLGGGVPPFSFDYHGLPSGCLNTDISPLRCAPRVTGTFLVGVTVTDALGATSTGSVLLQVNPLPSLNGFQAVPSYLTEYQALTLVAQAAGGTPPLSYFYSGLPPGCSSRNASLISCFPNAPGNFTVTLTVTDALGRSVAATTLVTVAPVSVSLAPMPQILAFFADPSRLVLGNTTTFEVIVLSTGVDFTLTFSGLPPGCLAPTSSPSSWTCTPSANGNYTIQLSLVDLFGRTTNATTPLIVHAAPTGPRVGNESPASWWILAAGAALGGLAGGTGSFVLARWLHHRPRAKAPQHTRL